MSQLKESADATRLFVRKTFNLVLEVSSLLLLSKNFDVADTMQLSGEGMGLCDKSAPPAWARASARKRLSGVRSPSVKHDW